MSNYFEEIPKKINDYFHILSNEIPDFIKEYIEAPEMQRLKGISMVCGENFTKMCPYVMYYSRLEHSIGVALIIWNFTKDKKQALAEAQKKEAAAAALKAEKAINEEIAKKVADKKAAEAAAKAEEEAAKAAEAAEAAAAEAPATEAPAAETEAPAEA